MAITDMPLSHSRIAILADTRQAAGCQPDRLEPSSRSPPASRKAASWHVRGNVVHRIDSKSSGGDSGLTQAAAYGAPARLAAHLKWRFANAQPDPDFK